MCISDMLGPTKILFQKTIKYLAELRYSHVYKNESKLFLLGFTAFSVKMSKSEIRAV